MSFAALLALLSGPAAAATPIEITGDDAVVSYIRWGVFEEAVLCPSVPCSATLEDGKYVLWVDGRQRRVIKPDGRPIHLVSDVLPEPPRARMKTANLLAGVGSAAGLGLALIGAPLGFPLVLTVPAVAAGGVGLTGMAIKPKVSNLAIDRGR